MQKNALLMCSALAALIFCFPIDALAQTTSTFSDQAFTTSATGVMSYLFGWPMRLIGGFAAVAGAVRAYFTHSMTPILVWGGIGLSVSLVPSFLNSVFSVSGMLIP